MAERTARLGSMHYRDADGQYRTASAGDVIQVHREDVERFDRLNVLMGEEPGSSVEPESKAEPETPEPVEEKPKPRRGRPPAKKAADE